MLYESIHLPVADAATDTAYKVFDHLCTVYRMQNFRMELDRIQIFLYILCCGDRAVCCISSNLKSRSKL